MLTFSEFPAGLPSLIVCLSNCDAFIGKDELSDSALDHLAIIVRAADTDRLDWAPQVSGLLAITLGLSHNIKDDHQMLKVGMTIDDALYAWRKLCYQEVHNWPEASKSRPSVICPRAIYRHNRFKSFKLTGSNRHIYMNRKI